MHDLCNAYRHDRADGESLIKNADRPFRFGSTYVRTDEFVIRHHRDHRRARLVLLGTYEIPLYRLVPLLHCEIAVANTMQGIGV